MIALDTNILVRLITQDDPQQAALAERLIQQATEEGEVCFVSDVVLCELEWVLEGCYGATRSDLLAAIQEIASREVFAFEDSDSLHWAIDLFRKSKVELSDALIGARARAKDARTTYTFDRVLSHHEGYSLLR
ncbi:MAG TPA: type II toxin-antitoxin system VapC family toxin [Thermoanaerobaculia bacterium]